MANTTFDSTNKTFDNQTLTFGLELLSQKIVLGVALSEFANTLLSAQQDTSIIQFIDPNEKAIDSTVEIPNTHHVYINVRQNLYLSDNLFCVENVAIQAYQSNTIQQGIDSLDSSVASGLSFGVGNLFVQIHPNSGESTLAFGSPQLNTIIYAQSIESTVSYGEDALKLYVTPTTLSSTLLFGDAQINSKIYSNSVSSTLAFGSPQLNTIIYAESAVSTLSFGSVENLNFTVNVNSVNSELSFGTLSVIQFVSPESVIIQNSFGTPKLNSILYANSYESAIAFGVPQINMEIDDVPFPSITSTVVIPNPNVRFNINPLSIATTANFGTATFIDNIHRMLVFKDDNISKIGDNDAGVVAGGIRINPSSAVANTAIAGDFTLPNLAAGFVSINIAGKDYLMPFFNA